MKNFAELKRVIQPGLKLKALAHWNPNMLNSIRTVTRVQGNGYWFRVPGDERDMWSEYFKAGNYTFPTADSFTFTIEGRGWTLQVVPDEVDELTAQMISNLQESA